MTDTPALGEDLIPGGTHAVRAAFLLVGLLAPLALHAQELPFRHHTAQSEINPLPESPVLAAYQDSLGYIWVANYGLGLVRYDGQAMEAYGSAEGGLGRQVYGMQEDGHGRLWVLSSDRGLAVSERPLADFAFSGSYPDSARVHFADTLAGTALYRKPFGFPVDKLDVDARGWVWVGTDADGLIRYRFDGPDVVVADTIRTGAVGDSTNAAVKAVAGRRDGSVWAGLRGGAVLVFEGDARTPSRTVDGPCPEPQSIYEDGSGALWIGCQDGALWSLRADAADASFERAGPTLPGTVTDILEVAPGMLWASGLGSGVWEIPMAAPDRATTYARENGLLDVNVWGLMRDREGNVWVSQNTGLSRLPPNHAAVRAYTARSHTGERPALPGVEALAVQPDVRVRSAEGGTAAVLAVGTTEGLALIHEDGTTEHVTAAQGLSNDVILNLCLDADERLWTTTRAGADLFDLRPGTPAPPLHASQRALALFDGQAALNTYPLNHTNACGPLSLIDGGTALCFARAGGFGCSVGDRWFFFGDAAGLPTGGIMSFALDASGHLYIGPRRGGLYRSTAPFSQEALLAWAAAETEAGVSTTITQPVFEPILDAAGEPVGGEYNYSLLRVSDAVWAVPTVGDLLILEGDPPRVVARIDADEFAGGANTLAQSPPTGSVWVGTSGGLVEMDPERRAVVRRVTEHDGLLYNESSGPGAVAVGADGTVYHSSTAGLTIYHPDLDRPNTLAPALAFRRIRFSEDAAGNNALELDYAGLSFADEGAVRYRTRLVGYDDDWSPPTAEASIRYTNLSAFAFPKTYTFEVVAANNDGVWAETPLAHAVRVRPPWWFRWWALLLYGATFAGSAFVVDRVQRRRLVQRERARAQQRENELRAEAAEARARYLQAENDQKTQALEQARAIERAYAELKEAKDRLVHAEKMASLGALTAGIAHEIKNPLNFVNNFAQLSRELAQELADEADPEERAALVEDLLVSAAKIEEHGRRADGIVRSMMQHAHGGEGEREAIDLNALVEEHVDLAYHGRRAQTPGFDVAIECDYGADVGAVEVVPQEVGRVVLNLVSNAFDAVAERAAQQNGQYAPRVAVSTRRADGYVEIRVEDNGLGMADEVRGRVFEPFFTTKPTGSGTGLGLSMSHDIVVQGHGGSLTAESEEGAGATFIVALPASFRAP